MSHKEDLETKLFLEDGKSVALMMSDFFSSKKIPVYTAILASLIFLTSICNTEKIPTAEIKKTMDVLMKGFPSEPINSGKDNNSK